VSDERKKPLWPWIVHLLIGLPVLYVANSGPMHGVAFRDTSLIGYEADGRVILSEPESWWPNAYAPVIWASERWWGKPLKRYWTLWPLVQAKE
jgi:hypothetical protein